MKFKKQKNPFSKDYLYEDGKNYGLYAIESLNNYPIEIENDYFNYITSQLITQGYNPYLYEYNKFFKGYIDALKEINPFKYKKEKENYYEQFGYKKVKPLLNKHIMLYSYFKDGLYTKYKNNLNLHIEVRIFIEKNLMKLKYITGLGIVKKFEDTTINKNRYYFTYNYSDFSDIDYYLKNLYTKPLK